MSIRSEILTQIIHTAAEQNKSLVPLADDLPLLHSGLDSLCLAVIVARLEDTLGIDPFGLNQDAEFPVTVGDFVKFYEVTAQQNGFSVSPSSVSQ